MLTQMMLAISWGLLFGTIINLVLIPCVYTLLGPSPKKAAEYVPNWERENQDAGSEPDSPANDEPHRAWTQSEALPATPKPRASRRTQSKAADASRTAEKSAKGKSTVKRIKK
jgi:hypothetical protein